MFTAYAEHIGWVQNGLNHTQYFCEECDQSFASAWGITPGMGGGWRGNRFHCTHCGKEHSKHVANLKRHEECPYKVRLSLKTFKDLVILDVFYESVYFDDVFGIRAKKNNRETFRFDIAKQIATFSTHCDKSPDDDTDMGNPFDLDIFNQSILRFFTSDSLALTNQKAELIGLLKLLRENVQSRMEKRLGHKVRPLHVSSGTLRGMFLVPIQNIAFRVTFPDAKNLPAVYRERIADIHNMWAKHMIIKYSFIQKVMELARKGTDFITAICSSLELPNTTAVRREISQNFFECGRLDTSFEILNNYDYAIRFRAAIKPLLDKGEGTFHGRDLFKYLHMILANYGESGLVSVVESPEDNSLKDCVRIYGQLNEESKIDLVTEHVRIRDLHDWMAKKHRKQNHNNMALDVPDHIVKRLSMQKDKLSFFLPKESMELLEAGAELHNCVASYGYAMKDHKKWIVLVADDKGKLAACLEIVGSTLVQAKLNGNKPVSNDAKLNAEIIAWADGANISINTHDVQLSIEEQKARAC